MPKRSVDHLELPDIGPKSKYQRNSDRLSRGFTNSTAGIVESIRLKNFLCHENLEFNLGHNLNFITGQNGSKFYL